METKKMVEISEDLRDLVTSTISSVKEGLRQEKCGVSGTIKFEVSVAKSNSKKGSFKVFVADASGDYTKDNTSKISFEISGILTESEKANLQNEIKVLQGNLSSSNAKIEQLTKQNQNWNNAINEQTSLLKQKEAKLDALNNQVKILTAKVETANKERDTQISQNQMLNDVNAGLQRQIDEILHPKPKPVH
jgi:chromosome segregation ATPase